MSPYLDIHRSLLAFCKGVITRHNLTEFQVFDFDAHAVAEQFPDKNLIGVMDYSIENVGEQYDVTCAIVVSTRADDSNLKKLRNVIDKLFTELKPGDSGDKFEILDSNGVRRGYLTVSDSVFAMPVGSTKTRPIQGIAVNFGAGYLALPA